MAKNWVLQAEAAFQQLEDSFAFPSVLQTILEPSSLR